MVSQEGQLILNGLKLSNDPMAEKMLDRAWYCWKAGAYEAYQLVMEISQDLVNAEQKMARLRSRLEED